jgi:hypothetical protein
MDAMTLLETTKKRELLLVRGDPTPGELIKAKEQMLCTPTFVSSFKESRSLAIAHCEDWINMNRLKALYCFKRRKEFQTEEQKCREPFSHSRFGTALNRVHRYIDCLKTHNINWIGLRFHFPIMWNQRWNSGSTCIRNWDFTLRKKQGTQSAIGAIFVLKPHTLTPHPPMTNQNNLLLHGDIQPLQVGSDVGSWECHIFLHPFFKSLPHFCSFVNLKSKPF